MAEIAQVLTSEAVAFVTKLEREFGDRRRSLLNKRGARQIEINCGKMPTFLPETEGVRQSYWKVATCPNDLLDRRVEITGPPDRKMIINALNSGANVYMADFEDSLSPTWRNVIQGHHNLGEAVDRTISFTGVEGRQYRLNANIATLMVRPRGWHLEEKHMLVEGHPVSASLFDFGMFFFHNAKKLIARGSGPYFYLPKIENHFEARLWNDVFLMAQDELEIPRGTIRATVLIETILAAFEMHEILHELKDHSAGLNCGRWDYIFSVIKSFRFYPEFILPDRSRITMTSNFLHAYSVLLIQACHKRGAHAIGGMAAQIPIKDNPLANEQALAKVQADKEREVAEGHDGTWVAHPGLVALAKAVFDAKMPRANQIDRKREDANITAADLLTVPRGEITETGLRTNISIALQYLASWLNGNGSVPIDNQMEDTATAEISRAQLWQWIFSPQAMLFDHRKINREMYQRFLSEELVNIRSTVGEDRFRNGNYQIAESLLNRIVLERHFPEFLTLPGYEILERT
ncbi:MAG TPA: malate synthase A [Bacteroidota bacterium]|nr:malate synthase A [Bacteroidota bacterium]